MVLFTPGQRIHFVGIGGVAMSAMARLLAARGCIVSGSDREASEVLQRLRAEGIAVREGHSARAVQGADLVIATAAVRTDNVEVAEARRTGIPVMGRAEALGRMMEGRRGIAVSGTHGKTTTTAMTALILTRAGLDPAVMVGGHVPEIGGNARVGAGPHFVAEADEFDRSFLSLRPAVAVVTTVEEEHLDCYQDLDDISDAFVMFVNRVPSDGFAVLCIDDPNVRALRPSLTARVLTCGLSPDADVSATGVTLTTGGGSEFTLTQKGAQVGPVHLRLPGLYNVRNALTAATVALSLGVRFEPIRDALEAFGGVGRRFETLGERNGVLVIDDYAHHPTEVEATLAGARSLGRDRIVVVFQPHLYSRTRDFAPGFGAALAAADRVVVTDVYAAREAPIEGVTGALVAEAARQAGAQVSYVPDRDAVPEALAERVRPGDLVIVMGAGDIRPVGEELLKRL